MTTGCSRFRWGGSRVKWLARYKSSSADFRSVPRHWVERATALPHAANDSLTSCVDASDHDRVKG